MIYRLQNSRMYPLRSKFKSLYLFLIVSTICLPLTAQNQIIGKVITSDKDSVVYNVNVKYPGTGRQTNGTFYSSGFEIPVDSIGTVSITVSSLSYHPAQYTFHLQSGDNRLPDIILDKNAIQLHEVQVRAKKINIERKGADFTIRNIQGTHLGEAGTLMDMLEWTPGVLVTHIGDEDHISVIGKGSPEIYINNRKIKDYSELRGLRSEDVSRIEIIRDPDASYKIGTTSAIRIYLKQSLKDHLGGSLTNSLRVFRKTSDYPRLELNGKSGIISGNVSVSYGHGKGLAYDPAGTVITHGDNDLFTKKSDGYYNWLYNRYDLFAGLNFALSKKSNYGIQYSGDFSKEHRYQFRTQQIDDNGNQWNKMMNDWTHTNNKLHSISTFYSWTQNENNTLTLVADYATRRNRSSNNILEKNLITEYVDSTYKYTPINYDIYTFNGDYSFTVKKKNKLSMGIELGDTKNKSDVTTNTIPQLINRKNFWLDSYTSYRRKLGKYGIYAGLRYEYDYTDTKLNDNGTKNGLKKIYSDFFPSATLYYNPNQKQSYSLGFQTGMSRPSFSDLSPIVFYDDSLHYFTGNPLLKPAFYRQVSLTANLGAFSINTFYVYEKDTQASILAHPEDNSNIIVTKPENIDHSSFLSFSVDYALNTNKVSLYTSGAIRTSFIKYPYLGKIKSFNQTWTQLSATLNYNFYKTFSIFSSLYYCSPCAVNLEKMGYLLSANAGISGNFLKKKLYVSIQGNDFFRRSVTPYIESYYGDIYSWRRNKYDTRGVILTLRYTFNSIKSPFRSRSGNRKILNRTN